MDTDIGYCAACGFEVDLLLSRPQRKNPALVLAPHFRGGRPCPGSLKAPSPPPASGEDERFAFSTTPPPGAQCGKCGGKGIDVLPNGTLGPHPMPNTAYTCSGSYHLPLGS